MTLVPSRPSGSADPNQHLSNLSRQWLSSTHSPEQRRSPAYVTQELQWTGPALDWSTSLARCSHSPVVQILVRQTMNGLGEAWSLGPFESPGRLPGCRSWLSTAGTVRAFAARLGEVLQYHLQENG